MLVSRGLLVSGDSPITGKIGVKQMFKSSRRRSGKNTVTAAFKLQFHASKLPQIGEDGLVISVVPAGAGKPTGKSSKASVRDGSCLWQNPVYESVKFSRDPKSGKVHERIYYFILGTSSSKSGVIIGEASIDFANYAEATKVSMVSLSLKCSKPEAVLNVSIQRIQEPIDCREFEEIDSAKPAVYIESAKSNYKEHSLKAQMEKTDVERVNSLITTRNGEDKDNSDVSNISEPNHESENGDLEEEEECLDIFIEKLKNEVASLTRKAEMSELELQTLRKQIVRESKRGQDLFKEVVCLKEEREALKSECGRIKSANTRNNNTQSRGDCWETVEELRQELNHVKEINSNLQIQLHRTQESNSELILAVRDLDEILEHKNKEILNGKVLDELVKENSDACFLEQQVIDLRGEIEICRRDRDEMEMQMEQLVLDYEIMKQENHEMAYKLEQSKIQEQLKIQYECSTEYTTVHELENQIENLENELKTRSEESEIAVAKISELEEDIEKQLEGFGVDLDSLIKSKVEQEQRAIIAEEELRKTKRKNADAAERIQEEFKKFSVQVGSTLKANETAAAKALAEAEELRLQKLRLEEIIKTASVENKTCRGSCLTSNDNSLLLPLKRCEDATEHLDELPKEMSLLKERNRLMEAELKEMQERYSEISVKFAEVESERQHLVMRVRNLMNAKHV